MHGSIASANKVPEAGHPWRMPLSIGTRRQRPPSRRIVAKQSLYKAAKARRIRFGIFIFRKTTNSHWCDRLGNAAMRSNRRMAGLSASAIV
jgi:hypothetical protein